MFVNTGVGCLTVVCCDHESRGGGIMEGGLLVSGPVRCPSHESGSLHAGGERVADDAGPSDERPEC